MEANVHCMFSSEYSPVEQKPEEKSLISTFFTDFSISGGADTYEGGEQLKENVFLPLRAKINDIISVEDLIFVLSRTGVCLVYRNTIWGSMEKLCCLNISDDEIIRSIFYNRRGESLMTVSVFKSDEWKRLRVRTTSVSCLRGKSIKDSIFVFNEEDLQYPGFVEFDDANGIALTFCAQKKVYRIWDLDTIQPLYSILGLGVKEIRIRGKPLTYVEFFEDFVLFKQRDENWMRVDLITDEVHELKDTEDEDPSVILFFRKAGRLVFMKNQIISLYDRYCRRIARIPYELYHHDTKTSNMYISENEDYLVAYCAKYTSGIEGSRKEGFISLIDIQNGSCLKIIEGSKLSDKAFSTLNSISCLTMNPERRELITASEQGFIHIWRFYHQE